MRKVKSRPGEAGLDMDFLMVLNTSRSGALQERVRADVF